MIPRNYQLVARLFLVALIVCAFVLAVAATYEIGYTAGMQDALRAVASGG